MADDDVSSISRKLVGAGRPSLSSGSDSAAGRKNSETSVAYFYGGEEDVLTVFLFIPNLLGYARIALALLALTVAFRSWILMSACYGLSQILDAADGWAARRYNQATIFGGVLDQVTDRLSTVGVLVLNSIVYPQFYLVFTFVLIFDLGGHWVHTFASVMAGSDSHKKIPTGWPLLKLYYENKPLMFICHGGNEIVWVALFALTQIPTYSLTYRLIQVLLLLMTPLCLLKNVLNFLQMLLGARVLASIDVEKRAAARE